MRCANVLRRARGRRYDAAHLDTPGSHARRPEHIPLEEEKRMQKYMRWSAILVVLMLVLAACTSDGGAGSPDEAASEAPASEPVESEGGGTGSAADCDADEFGCIELAEGDPLVMGTAMVITGPDESLGLDSQYGAEVARTLRPEIAGHEVEFNHQDDGCNTEGGTAAARALLSEENIDFMAGDLGTQR